MNTPADPGLGLVPAADDDRPVGAACWIDLGVGDTARIAPFYGALCGWDVAPADIGGYRLASREGNLVAAFGPAEDPGNPYWTVYLRTDDAVSTVAAIEAGGGMVVSAPASVGDAGIAATVRDPTGATFALWQPVGLTGSWEAHRAGTLGGFQLRIDDLVSAWRFWRMAMGWQFDDDGAIRRDDRRVGTWCLGAKGETAATPWLIHLRTNDVGAALTEAIELGATIDDAERGVLRDPAGSRFRLVPTREPHA